MAWLRVALMVVSSMCVQSFWCQAARKAALLARTCLARHGLGCFDEATHRAPFWLEQAQSWKEESHGGDLSRRSCRPITFSRAGLQKHESHGSHCSGKALGSDQPRAHPPETFPHVFRVAASILFLVVSRENDCARPSTSEWAREYLVKQPIDKKRVLDQHAWLLVPTARRRTETSPPVSELEICKNDRVWVDSIAQFIADIFWRVSSNQPIEGRVVRRFEN